MRRPPNPPRNFLVSALYPASIATLFQPQGRALSIVGFSNSASRGILSMRPHVREFSLHVSRRTIIEDRQGHCRGTACGQCEEEFGEIHVGFRRPYADITICCW